MKQSPMCKYLLLWLSVAMGLPVAAQNKFAYKATLDTVKQSSFYNINLLPAVVAGCKSDISDIRLKDNRNNEVPYILQKAAPVTAFNNFTELPIINSNNKNIVIQNTQLTGISEMLLYISNSEAGRVVTLSGSNDAIHWFIIKENIVLQNGEQGSGGEFTQSLSFPFTKYLYLQISFTGKDVMPLHIVKAGITKQNIAENKYEAIPAPAIAQYDSSDKQTYIWLHFNNAYRIDKLHLTFTGAKYFKRRQQFTK